MEKTEGIMFLSYTLLTKEERYQQLVDWCTQDFDGCLILDECHKAKNATTTTKMQGSKTAEAVVSLQCQLGKSRVVYASATGKKLWYFLKFFSNIFNCSIYKNIIGASETQHLAYMVRLGLWGPGTEFENFSKFKEIIEQRFVNSYVYLYTVQKLVFC